MPKRKPVAGETWEWHPQLGTALPFLITDIFWLDNFQFVELRPLFELPSSEPPGQHTHRLKLLVESPDWQCIKEIPIYNCARCHHEINPAGDPDYLCKRCRSRQDRAA